MKSIEKEKKGEGEGDGGRRKASRESVKRDGEGWLERRRGGDPKYALLLMSVALAAAWVVTRSSWFIRGL